MKAILKDFAKFHGNYVYQRYIIEKETAAQVTTATLDCFF